jgi:serine/threonine protein phosphatase PrpC
VEWRRLIERRTRSASPNWLDAGGASRRGRRDENQDRWLLRAGLGVVSDGMGGYRGGATAAELTVAGFVAGLHEDQGRGRCAAALRAGFQRANDDVRRGQELDEALGQMGATLTVAVLVDGDVDRSCWLVANVGDSPAIRAGAGRSVQITTDDTVPGLLLRDGAITEAEALAHPYRHVVLHAIGVEPDVEVEVTEIEVAAGDALVLVSDGVSDVLDVDEIGRSVSAASSATEAAERLADAALAHGTSDNVTALVLRHVASSVRAWSGG